MRMLWPASRIRYMATHPFFLDDSAIFALVADLENYERNPGVSTVEHLSPNMLQL